MAKVMSMDDFRPSNYVFTECPGRGSIVFGICTPIFLLTVQLPWCSEEE